MSTRCLNKATLIGNLTNDPELRYTPSGIAVCSFGVATNRSWTTQEGEKKEAAQFHRIVAWAQLAEICSQLLSKGAKVYVEGRIQYRDWVGKDELKRQTTEIVIEEMVLLSSSAKRFEDNAQTDDNMAAEFEKSQVSQEKKDAPVKEKKSTKKQQPQKLEENDEDIPF